MSKPIRIVPNSSHGLGAVSNDVPAPGSYDLFMPGKGSGEIVLEIIALAVGGALGSLLWKVIERWLDGDEWTY
jgi:hypothetical protein